MRSVQLLELARHLGVLTDHCSVARLLFSYLACEQTESSSKHSGGTAELQSGSRRGRVFQHHAQVVHRRLTRASSVRLLFPAILHPRHLPNAALAIACSVELLVLTEPLVIRSSSSCCPSPSSPPFSSFTSLRRSSVHSQNDGFVMTHFTWIYPSQECHRVTGMEGGGVGYRLGCHGHWVVPKSIVLSPSLVH